VSVPKDDKITLSADEWKVLFLVNGQRTLTELVAEAEDDALNVYRIIYGLQSNRLIEPIQPPASPDDTNRVTDEKPIVPQDDTFRQRSVFNPDTTVHEMGDDTDLLVSTEARLSWSDVIKPFVAQFRVSNGDTAGKVIALSESEYTLGRQRDNAIHISDLGVSGYHARVFRTPDGYAIEDLKSRNGIWINGGRVFHAALRDGDQVRVGATDLKYEVLIEPPKRP
jgi:hypothetical protein